MIIIIFIFLVGDIQKKKNAALIFEHFPGVKLGVEDQFTLVEDHIIFHNNS